MSRKGQVGGIGVFLLATESEIDGAVAPTINSLGQTIAIE